jgi:hypothetical protein
MVQRCGDMSAARYVPTRAIQAAVKDRENEVLDALGIPWREGRPHVRCPYPTLADGDPSWRWDERKARARCDYSKAGSTLTPRARAPPLG